ncbi:thioredoxin family protein [Candidatus Electronema sp. PJ]|uniref:thioredoxin family protein n=1 Tax=Candidatus Electronema sp. PJ TaxID=3401572 RepID=UPI003AA859C1
MRRDTIHYILLMFIVCTLNSCGPEADIPANAEYGKGAEIKVFKFYADWCGPCQAMKPEYEKVKKLYPHVEFYEVDFDKNRDKAVQFGIESVPFVIRLKNRKEVKKNLGYMSRNDLVRFIEND